MSDLDTPPDVLENEATPDQAVPLDTPSPAEAFGLHDEGWSQEEWLKLLQELIRSGMTSWKDVTALVLGHLNPSQVGTSLASSEGFKKRYGKGNTMKIVMEWVYSQTGTCADCGSRLELQADHIKGREQYEDGHEADFIENMTLRCRRCNVVRRPSHEFGGLTFLTTEAALMWILLVIRPRTLKDYIRMCRLYGMTMADIRMNEAWAMAHWLSRANPPLYGIENDGEGRYDVLLWADGAITRVDPGDAVPNGATRIYDDVSGASRLGFVIRLADNRLKFFERAISSIPFSTYDLGHRPLQALCIQYSAPDRQNKTAQKLALMPPRGCKLITHAIAIDGQRFKLTCSGPPKHELPDLNGDSSSGKILLIRATVGECVLSVY